MSFRLAAMAAILSFRVLGQTPAAPDDPAMKAAIEGDKSTETAPGEIAPDRSDPAVVRAQQNLDRTRMLVQQGALPLMNLTRAQDELQNALDMSILRYSAVTSDLTVEQANQMVTVAERLYLRRQKQLLQAQRLVASGAISRMEAESSGADVASAQLELSLAQERSRLVQDLADAIRRQQALADAESEAESHPEWNGKLYTRYDGSGVFTRADFEKISSAFLAAFGRPIPVSADGQTAVHRSMGFNHAGRVDIAVSPDQKEGTWLMRFLEKNRIPYFAFRTAIAHKATGAHIHLGTGSGRLTASLR